MLSRQNSKKAGLWRNPEKVGQKFLREEGTGGNPEPSDAFPININKADAALLKLGSKTMEKLRPNVLLK